MIHSCRCDASKMRGVAYYAPGRYPEVLEALGRLMVQTFHSRLYRSAALIVLGRPEEAGRVVKETLASKPNFTVSRFLFQEHYRDPLTRQQLRCRLEDAGLTP